MPIALRSVDTNSAPLRSRNLAAGVWPQKRIRTPGPAHIMMDHATTTAKNQ